MDLHNVNAFVSKVKFKYEDLRCLTQVLEENHWFFTWDLKSGYHHVDIFADQQKDFCGKLKTTVLLVSRTSSTSAEYLQPSTFQRKELRLSGLVTY